MNNRHDAVSSGDDVAAGQVVSNLEEQWVSWIFFHLNTGAADFPSSSSLGELNLISVIRCYSDCLACDFALIELLMAHEEEENY